MCSSSAPPMPCTVPPGDLALDHVRVDHRAAVLADDVAQERRPARWRRRPRRCRRGSRSPSSTGPSALNRPLASSPGGTSGGQRGGREVREAGDLGDGDRRGRRPAHVRRARATTSMSASTAASKRWAAMATIRCSQHAGGLADRAGEHGPAAAAAGAAAEAGERGVALDRVHVLDVDAERVGRELDDGRLEAVARGAAGDVDVDLAGGLDADRRRPRSRRCRTTGVVGST